jgi:hypothetical protein
MSSVCGAGRYTAMRRSWDPMVVETAGCRNTAELPETHPVLLLDGRS